MRIELVSLTHEYSMAIQPIFKQIRILSIHFPLSRHTEYRYHVGHFFYVIKPPSRQVHSLYLEISRASYYILRIWRDYQCFIPKAKTKEMESTTVDYIHNIGYSHNNINNLLLQKRYGEGCTLYCIHIAKILHKYYI